MRPCMLPALALGAVLATALAAQEPEPGTFAHSRHGATFDEGPRQAARLMPGMNAAVHLPVAGLSDPAQAFFDQGLTQLHGFWYFEAERSFRQVAMLHPDCAMAYWGMALANVENDERAAGCIAHAVQRSHDLPRLEQLWIDAYARFYGIDDACRAELRSGDEARARTAREQLIARSKERKAEPLHRELIKDLGTIVHEFPDDIEAKALLAVEIWLASDWGNGIGIVSHTAVDALLDQVFARAPLHPAHHYRIHLWDHEAAVRALRSAAAIGHSAPGIAHQWHMGGHIFDKLKRHADAAWQQEASSRVDHAHMMRDAVMPFLIHNYGHNQEWLCRSLQHVGRAHEALALARNMVEMPRHPRHNRVGEDRDIAGYGRRRLLQVLSTFELWQELRQTCERGLVEPTGSPVADSARALHLGLAAYRLGDLTAGERALQQLDELLAQARAERASKLDEAEEQALARKEDRKQRRKAVEAAVEQATEPVTAVRARREVLRGVAALAQLDGKAALACFEDQREVPRHLLAEAHALAGDADRALAILQQDADENENRVAPLVHLIAALHARNEHDRARAAFARLRTVGAEADLDTPLLQRLRAIARDYELSEDWRLPRQPAADAGAADRPELALLGPLCWSPTPAPGFDLPGADGARHQLSRGRAVLVVFYLGFGCLHCVEQLHALHRQAHEFAALGIDVVAIGTDEASVAAASLASFEPAARFPFPLLADPGLDAFKAWRCHDDFEGMALHGTFLVDAAGHVRWQDISAEPFVQFEWLCSESRRLLGLPGTGAGSK